MKDWHSRILNIIKSGQISIYDTVTAISIDTQYC